MFKGYKKIELREPQIKCFPIFTILFLPKTIFPFYFSTENINFITLYIPFQ